VPALPVPEREVTVSDFTSLLVWLPIGAAIAVWVLPLSRYATGALAVLVSLAEVGIWIEQAARFDFARHGLQFSQQHSWIKDLGVSYHVGEYGFSLWLVGLTVVAMAASIGYGFWVGRDRPRAYFGLMLFLTGATVGVFVAQDLLLFYAFFEGMLIPLYVLVGVWGGAGRLGATVKLLIYTMAGSLLMLAALIVYGLKVGTFDLVDAPASPSRWIFLGFMFAFAIKAPLFPFHGWLPDAYREAPPEVTAVLSGVIAKAGTYGMLRIAIAKFPEPTSYYRTLMLTLGALSLVYGSVLAFRSPTLRGVVAYSSLAQSGLITIGLFAGTNLGYDGAVLQMVAHGLISTALFLIAGTIERRTTTDEFALLGGMAKGRPALATLLMTVGIISLAVPGSASFAGEFLILAGAFQRHWWWAVIGAGAIVLAAMYMLRAISAVLHEARGSTVSDEAMDLRPGELALVVPLVAALLVLSAWPAGISHHAFAGDNPAQVVKGQFR
jgi:NADH-quinone oxidoreductase subunit M